jgi:hypothetical protein
MRGSVGSESSGNEVTRSASARCLPPHVETGRSSAASPLGHGRLHLDAANRPAPCTTCVLWDHERRPGGRCLRHCCCVSASRRERIACHSRPGRATPWPCPEPRTSAVFPRPRGSVWAAGAPSQPARRSSHRDTRQHQRRHASSRAVRIVQELMHARGISQRAMARLRGTSYGGASALPLRPVPRDGSRVRAATRRARPLRGSENESSGTASWRSSRRRDRRLRSHRARSGILAGRWHRESQLRRHRAGRGT